MKKFVITEKLNQKIKSKNLSQRKLAKMIDYDDAGLNARILGKKSFSESVINKILPLLEVSREEFESWILADKYPKEVLKLAIQAKKEFPYKRKSILTARIDEILEQKEISRTILAKQINYDQSSINRMITKKINISEPVLEKLSEALGISQNEISSWIIADKYSLAVLEQACFCLKETPSQSN